MATYSPVLGLKLNDESDPFQLSDFIENWDVLDASPGIYVCTSTSQPSWGTAQAGRLIFMSDLKQLSYWDGANWNDLRDSAPVFAGGLFINTHQGSGTSAIYNVLTLTTPRPCALAIALTGLYLCANNLNQDLYQSIVFDGVQQQMGGFRQQMRFTAESGGNGALAGTNSTSFAVIPSVSAGQHKIGVQVDVSSDYAVALRVSGAQVLGMISLFNSGNSL